MAIFNCNDCGIHKEIPDQYLGSKVRCPSCKRAITVEASPQAEVPVESDEQDAKERPVLIVGGVTEDTTKEEHIEEPTEEELPLPSSPPPPPTKKSSEPTATISLATPESREQISLPLLHGGVLPNVAAGIESGILLLFFCLSFALLIPTAAPKAASVGLLLGMTLISSTACCIYLSIKSGLPILAAGPETAACSILYLLALSLNDATANLSQTEASATMFAGLVAATFATGITALVALKYDAGKLLRFIPQPIVGGLQAAMGLLLIRGALQISTEGPFCIQAILPTLNAPDCLKWIPALALGVLLFIFLHSRKSALINLGILFFGIAVGHSIYMFWEVPIEEAREIGLLLKPAVLEIPWNLVSTDLFGAIQWQILIDHAPYLFATMTLIILTLADKIYTLEVLLENEINLSSLVKNIGTANIISGLAGGLPGSISVSRCIGTGPISKRGPLAGIIAGLLCGSALFWGGTALGYIPRFVPSGLLIFFGISLMVKWLVDAKREFTRSDDYTLLVVIFLVCSVFGMLIGMAAGFCLTVLLLARRYGNMNVIKHLLSGSAHRSRVDRSADEIAVLKRRGDEIMMMRLQGFIFLGTTSPLLQTIRERLYVEEASPLRYLIMDFSRVSGLDSQVAISFTQLKQLAAHSRFTLIFANVPFEVEQQLEAAGYALNASDGSSLSFVDTDYALEWCEDHILLEEDMLDTEEKALPDLLAPIFPDPNMIPDLMQILERLSFADGEVVFRQGDTSDAMYFIEEGMITIQLELGGKKTTRLKKMAPGTVFGEMGIYTNAPRSASAVADGECVLYRLSQQSLEGMHSDPRLLSSINRFVVHLLSQRVADANMRVMDLLR